MAAVAAFSPFHFHRVFRGLVGEPVKEHIRRLRLERARSLLRDPGLTMEGIAARCGFESARQLRRVWKEAFGAPPSAARTGIACR